MLVDLKDALNSALSKIESVQENMVALPARDNPLRISEAEKLRQAIAIGWKEEAKYGPWKSWDYGFEPGEIIDVNYKITGKLNDSEMIAITNEAMRPSNHAAIKQHVASLAAHKRYNGGDGFSFIQIDLANALAGYSEYAVIQAFNYLKNYNESPWFPQTHEILKAVEWEENKLRKLKNSP